MECSDRCSLEIKDRQLGKWQGTGCGAPAVQAGVGFCVRGRLLKAGLMALVTAQGAFCSMEKSQVLGEPGTGEWGHTPWRLIQPLVWQSCVAT